MYRPGTVTGSSPRRRRPKLPALRSLESYEQAHVTEGEREHIERWLALVPKIKSLKPYRAQFQALDDYFLASDLEGEDLHLWRAIREVIMQRNAGIYEDILPLTDIVVQDLFYFFVRHERLTKVRPKVMATVPLTFFGKSEDYYYTYVGDQHLPFAVVSIPQARIYAAWNWLAIPHEVGHHVIGHFPGYEEELQLQLATALRPLRPQILERRDATRQSNKSLVAHIWFFWLEEVVSDLFGILFTGPAQVMARQEDAAWLLRDGTPVNASVLGTIQESPARHPTPFVRNYFQTAMLRELGYGEWADVLDQRWIRRWGQHEVLEWYDDLSQPPGKQEPLLVMAVAEMRRLFKELLPRLLYSPVASLGGERLIDLIHYDEEDHGRVERIREGLLAGQDQFERKDRARHILAASRLAYEQSPASAEAIHQAAATAIGHCRQWLKLGTA